MARWRSYKNKADHCFYCLRSVEEVIEMGWYMTVDHIIPRGKGGSDEPENLVSACERCNNCKDSDDGWYEGCVYLEGFGNPEWYRDMLKVERERGNGNLGSSKEYGEGSTEGTGTPEGFSLG